MRWNAAVHSLLAIVFLASCHVARAEPVSGAKPCRTEQIIVMFRGDVSLDRVRQISGELEYLAGTVVMSVSPYTPDLYVFIAGRLPSGQGESPTGAEIVAILRGRYRDEVYYLEPAYADVPVTSPEEVLVQFRSPVPPHVIDSVLAAVGLQWAYEDGDIDPHSFVTTIDRGVVPWEVSAEMLVDSMSQHGYPDELVAAETVTYGIPLGWNEPSDIEIAASRPEPVTSLTAHPNPFNPSTTLRYSIAAPGDVELAIYNAMGQHVRTLDRAPVQPGHHTVVWDGTDATGRAVGSGVYTVRLSTHTHTLHQRVTLLR